MPHSETLGLLMKSRTLKVICTEFRPSLLPTIELGGCVPFTDLVAKSIRPDFAHREKDMNVNILVTIVGMRRMNGHVDNHSLAGHVLRKILGESQPLLGIQFER